MGYHGTGLGPKEDGIRQPLEANSYPKGNGLGSIKPKVSFAKKYGMVEPDSEIEEEEFFEVPFQYIEDDLDNHVHAITITNISSTNLPLTNPDMIDWDLQDTPPALNICKSDEAVMALFGLKNLQDYEHEIQYNEEAYFGSQVNSLSRKSEKEKEKWKYQRNIL